MLFELGSGKENSTLWLWRTWLGSLHVLERMLNRTGPWGVICLLRQLKVLRYLLKTQKVRRLQKAKSNGTSLNNLACPGEIVKCWVPEDLSRRGPQLIAQCCKLREVAIIQLANPFQQIVASNKIKTRIQQAQYRSSLFLLAYDYLLSYCWTA